MSLENNMEEKSTKNSPEGDKNDPFPEKETKTFSILGCCVSRDIFEISKDKSIYDYKINSFWARSVLSIFSNKIKNFKNISIDDINEKSNWKKKCILVDLSKEIIKKTDFTSDYILIDIGSIRNNLIYAENQPLTYLTFGEVFQNNLTNIEKLLDTKLKIEYPFRISDEYLYFCLDSLCQKILKYKPVNRIILNELVCVKDYIKTENNKEITGQFIQDINWQNNLFKKCYDYLEKKLKGCHILKIPENTFCDYNHKWGPHPLHYVSEVYDYFIQALDVICSDFDFEKEKLLIRNLQNIYSNLNLNKYKITKSQETINNLNTQIQSLEQSNSDLNVSLQNQVKENQKLNNKIVDFQQALSDKNTDLEWAHKEIQSIKSSKSYKIGSAITYIPRKIFKRKKTI